MILYSFSVLCFSFGVLLVAALALVKRKDAIAIRFLFFSLAVSGWGFFEAVWFPHYYSRNTTLVLIRIANAFALWIPITWLHFVFDFINKKEPFKYFYIINYGMAFVLTCFSHTIYFISGVHPVMNFEYYPSPGHLYHLFVAIFLFLVPYGFMYLIKALRLGDVRREQLKHFSIATIIGFAAGGTAFLPVYKISFPLILFPLMPLYPFFVGTALIKYGLFDMQEIADAFQREKITALGIMAASLNHEIRNPLYVAKGRIETYLDGVERKVYQTSEARQSNADTVLNSASNHLQRALDTLQRFSDFAKPFNAQKEKQTVDLDLLFRDVRELVSHALETRCIVLKENLGIGQKIQGNRRQLEEIFVNLMMNAIQAVKQQNADGKSLGVIEFSAEQVNGDIRIQIKDNGPGMDAEQSARIFEPFYTTKEKGTGLGLYITKQLVERNGGKIEVRSKKGGGTVFSLIFRGVETEKVLQK